ncbi:MAG: segregation/condensation protein A [Bacilli bacterium]|nr:segregation/condensation protein A [Bacilli bacterium]MBO6194811.1 segregation/condensation protein A [Bacilli bacterium]
MQYNFVINDFEGPLDLLLHLVKTSKMDIYDISIEKITKQYLDFIKSMQEMNLDVASEYLVMASELIEIKSKLLLPNNKDLDPDEYEEDPRENLINRMLEYEKYKNMIETFKELENERKDIFTKEPINLNEYRDTDIKNEGDVSLEDLLNALNEFLQRKEELKPRETKITKKELSVTQRTSQIRNILRSKKKVSFFDLFEIKTKEYVVVTFLSILEMAKHGEIKIIQENNFNNIIIDSKEVKEDE